MSGENKESFRALTRYSAGALEMGISVVVGLAIGYWLDEIFHTAPWMALFWLTCGAAAGMRGLLRLAKKIEKEDAEDEARGPDEKPR